MLRTAAVITAVAFWAWASGHAAEPAEVSDLVYESERFYHGTPSGIDNTVVAYGMPIWFVKGQPPEPFVPAHPISLAIADSGIRSPTKETVGDVRRAVRQRLGAPLQQHAMMDVPTRHAGRCIFPGVLLRIFRQGRHWSSPPFRMQWPLGVP